MNNQTNETVGNQIIKVEILEKPKNFWRKNNFFACLGVIISLLGISISVISLVTTNNFKLSYDKKVEERYEEKGMEIIINSINGTLNTLAMTFELLDNSKLHPLSDNQLNLIIEDLKINREFIAKIDPTNYKKETIINIQTYVQNMAQIESKMTISFNDIISESENYRVENNLKKDGNDDLILNQLYLNDVILQSALENIVIQINLVKEIKEKVNDSSRLDEDYSDYFKDFEVENKDKLNFLSDPNNQLT